MNDDHKADDVDLGVAAIHYLMFMVNESTGRVAAHFECVNALVDLQARKTTPYPAEILTRIDAMLAEQGQLAWAPPISGAMQVGMA